MNYHPMKLILRVCQQRTLSFAKLFQKTFTKYSSVRKYINQHFYNVSYDVLLYKTTVSSGRFQASKTRNGKSLIHQFLETRLNRKLILINIECHLQKIEVVDHQP